MLDENYKLRLMTGQKLKKSLTSFSLVWWEISLTWTVLAILVDKFVLDY